ncbi:hypothetical protein AMECASPLE_027503, partial [Ameca splendens]
YKMISDPAGWLNIDTNTGKITVRDQMDRESLFVKEEKYTALIGAYDDDQMSATGTGTLVIKLEDVNDNPPAIDEREFKVCNKRPAPQLLTVTDKDGPSFSSPFSVHLRDSAKANWTARMNGTRTGIILTLNSKLQSGEYRVALSVSDNQGLSQVSTVTATVCDCTGEELSCPSLRIGGSGFPVILVILGVVLLLLIVVTVVLVSKWKKPKTIQPSDTEYGSRDKLVYYDEQGGGEDDQQEYDHSIIHYGMTTSNKLRCDMAPTDLTTYNRPQYRPHPTNQEEIGNFIDDNLKVADTDPTAPPFDSLLVFDLEGSGSKAESLSSLYSSKDGDQDYDCLKEWGPRFKKLADMYGGGEDDELL